jgi:hypothetical protein
MAVRKAALDLCRISGGSAAAAEDYPQGVADGMIEEREIWQCAALVVKRYGGHATPEAARGDRILIFPRLWGTKTTNLG